ncbi:MAG TPA: fused MFS/spermidine synthase, partial [Bacteroidota bacterium]|nr:fused MFS/spermidine synthase [Bacteroidota bacterium]
IVAVAGASVLALEILGTRILGPHFGVSLFLWSALITVTLAALAIGYLIGGSWADRFGSYRRLCSLMGIAGAWIVAIPWMQTAVIGMVSGWEIRGAIIGSSAILFFVPLMILGAVTPYAIRLTLTAVEQAGRTSGRLFALSTIASVASALLTGFYLIPNLGVFLLTTVLGTLLLLTAGAGYIAERGTGKVIVQSLVFGIVGLAALVVSPVERADPENGLIAVRQSPYAEIRIFDNPDGRHFLIDRGIHSRIDTATRQSTLPYTAVMEIPKRYFSRPGRMLLIGLGGGSLVRCYTDAGWEVDAVEIDPEVIAMAREYFDLDGAGGAVYETDGRRYLATTAEKYDIVLIDAYGSSSIPFHLVTAEAFGLSKSVLNDGGILAVNVISLGWRDPLVLDIAGTLRIPFRDVLALPMAEPPDRLGNLILLAGDRDLGGIPDPEGNVDLDPDWRYGPGYAIAHAWDNRFSPETAGRRALTDDLNPIDLRSEVTMLAARREVREYFARLNVKW